MIEATHRIGVFALYQFAVVLGILLFPVALLAQRFGVRFPLGRLVERLGTAYDNVGSR